MKHHYLFALLTVFFMIFSASAGQAQTYSTLPYSTGFETGTLDASWTATSSLTTGEIAVFTAITGTSWGDALPHSGTYFLGMHHPSAGGGAYNLNEAKLHLDLTGVSNRTFSFYWAEWNDETSVEDGVYFSDDGGLTYVKVISLNGDSYTDLTYTYFSYNLDSMLLANGLTASSSFVIKFQQYDNYYFNGGNDGFLIDDITVGGCVTPVADFTYAADSTGLLVSFTNLSTDTTGLVNWNFGDGTFSSDVNPEHNYSAPGTYQVELYINNPCGDDTLITNINVCIPLLVSETDTALDLQGNYEFSYSGTPSPGLSFHWDFGDGTTSTDSVASHHFGAPGVYTIVLTVTDACGNVYPYTWNEDVVFEAISEETADQLQLYPNPSYGYITIASANSNDRIERVEVFSETGQCIQEIVNTANSATIGVTIDGKGVFLIRVTTVDSVFVRQVAVQ